ncbi:MULTISPECIES: VC0807 family protein [unclassified Mycobacterium]|uniref:VC0807 family protein n=1 Tax=unclassified Mycobacterium TaxID=2642494 RepID=UPI0009937EE6|nr:MULTISPECIES: VC0807 family protein [unclassified Mycobacterium]
MPDQTGETQKSSAREVLRQVLVSVGPSLGTYYALRALGQPEIHALIAATVVSGLQVLVKVVKNRKFDVLSGFLMFNFGLSLVIALLTSDARMAQVSNTIPGILLSLFFIGSALIGKPLTELMIAKARPGRIEEIAAEHHWTENHFRSYYRMHVHVSFWCGVISLLLAAISIVIIYSFSVDIAQAVNQIFSLVTTMGLIIGIIVVIRRYLQRMTYDSPAA